MIIERIDSKLLARPFDEALELETKADLLQAAGIWGIKIPQSCRKGEIALAMKSFLETDAQYVWNYLEVEEMDMLDDLIEAGKGGYVTIPYCETLSRLQKSLLVVSVVDKEKGECRLYMLDAVYDIFKALQDRQDEEFEREAKDFFDQKRKEVAEAKRADEENEPINFLPALTCNPPRKPLEGELFAYRLIRPLVMEVTVRLSAERYMVCYFLGQKDYVHAVCNWGHVLDFVRNGFDEYARRMKKPFSKKYPKISRTYGEKVYASGEFLPEPYLGTIGFGGQPKTWFIAEKMRNVEFSFFAIFGPRVNDNYGATIKVFRDLCVSFFNEIMRSDAKSPKTLMKEYFGFDTLPVDEWPEGHGIKPIVDDLDELGNLDELDDEDDWDE